MTKEFFIRHDSYYANSTPQFSGPYASREEAEAAVSEIAERFGTNFNRYGEHACDLRYERQYQILAASQVDAAEYAQFVRSYYNSENDEPISYNFVSKTENKKLSTAIRNVEY